MPSTPAYSCKSVTPWLSFLRVPQLFRLSLVSGVCFSQFWTQKLPDPSNSSGADRVSVSLNRAPCGGDITAAFASTSAAV